MRRATIRTVHGPDGDDAPEDRVGIVTAGDGAGDDTSRGDVDDGAPRGDVGTTAQRVAMALVPDNTDEMETAVDGDAIVTQIERETTGGLSATVDDYVVNLDVATTVVQQTNDSVAGVNHDGSRGQQTNTQRHNE